MVDPQLLTQLMDRDPPHGLQPVPGGQGDVELLDAQRIAQIPLQVLLRVLQALLANV